MAWPFSNPGGAPNTDSGFVTVPAVVGNPPNFNNGSTFWLMGCTFSNPNAADAFITVTDGSNNAILSSLRVPAFGVVPLEWPFLPTVGVQWVSTAPITGKIWGYT